MHRELRDRLYVEPMLRGDIRIIDDKLFDDDGLHILTVLSERLPSGRNGMRAICIRDGVAEFQDDLDT